MDILFRRPCFLSSTEWLTTPWSLDPSEKSPTDEIIDVLACIPGLLVQVDRVRSGSSTLEVLDALVTDYTDALERWRLRNLATIPAMDMEAIIAAISEGSFENGQLAHSVALYLACLLFVTRIGSQYTEKLPLPPQRLINGILRICEEYSCRREGHGLMPWLFPLRVALFTPLHFACVAGTQVFDRVDQHYSVEIMTRIKTSLPGFNTQMSLAAPPGTRLTKPEFHA